MTRTSAAQRGKGGLWHYVYFSRNGAAPIGYCLSHRDELHLSEIEARLCFQRWLVDNIVLAGEWAEWSGCNVAGCDQPTKHHAFVRGNFHLCATLCDYHMTRAFAIEVMGLNNPQGYGDTWGSG